MRAWVDTGSGSYRGRLSRHLYGDDGGRKLERKERVGGAELSPSLFGLRNGILVFHQIWGVVLPER